MNRRTFLAAAAATTASISAAPTRSSLGIATTCYLSYLKPRDAHAFLEFCAERGAGGVQSMLPTDPVKFRARCEQLGMFYEAMLQLSPDVEVMRASIRKAKESGATACRVGALSGRRYETFSTMDDWKKFVSDSRAKIAAASKAAEAEKLPLGLENHKDWTLEDALSLMKEFGHENFGMLLDTGNNISLLDNPHEFVEKLAPYATVTHLKDMAWQEHSSGFEMSEMVFGQGQLDMPKIINTIRKARPKTRMVLEMITRNPLVVPCLTEKYWMTMPHRPATFLANTLRMVRENKPSHSLPRMDQLSPEARLKLEDDNVKACLTVARNQYGL